MFDEDAALTVRTVVHDGSVQPLALEVVLYGPAALHRRVDANADDAETEKAEHGQPLQYRDACAFASHLSRDAAVAVLACQILRLFARLVFRDLSQRL